MRVVVLVPWRSGKKYRELNWNITRPYLEKLGWPLYTGDSEGPWARAAACNNAAEAAGDWDVAVIADADTIPEAVPVGRAVARVYDHGGAIRPHDRLYALNPVQSKVAARLGPESVRLAPRQMMFPGGGLLVISRRAWDTVGGFDEDFIGWGHEDSHMATKLLVEADWDRIPGRAWHLWHPREPKATPNQIANRERMRQIQEQNRSVIERESERRGWDIGAHL